MEFHKGTQGFYSLEDHKEAFAKAGIKGNIKSSSINGSSAYATVEVRVLDAKVLPCDLFIYEGEYALLNVRHSDHQSKVSIFGIIGNKCSLSYFSKLIEDKIITL